MGLGRILALTTGLTACAAPEMKPEPQLYPPEQYEAQRASLEQSLSTAGTAQELRDFASVQHCRDAIGLQILAFLDLNGGMGSVKDWAAADRAFVERSRINRKLIALACRGQDPDNPAIKAAEAELRIVQDQANSDFSNLTR